MGRSRTNPVRRSDRPEDEATTGSFAPPGSAHGPAGPPLRDSAPSEPLRLIAELTVLLLSARTVEEVLRRVTVTAQHAIPGADLVSITLREQDGALCTPVQSAQEATELDQAQYRDDEGPCIDAADPAGPAFVLSTDLSRERAWPAFTRAATAHGYVSILSTALMAGPALFTGALNIYSRRVDGLDTDARDFALLLATHASLALTTAHTRQDLAEYNEKAFQLRKAIDTRTVIGQATGILMGRRGLTAEDAFEVLSRTSQNRNVKLTRLAELLADRPHIADRL
jgi:GAF domain-containing protein